MAVLPAFALLLAACGGTATSAAGTNTSLGKSGKKTILVGISYPTGGSDAIYSNKFKAAQVYLNYLNQHGGVNGYSFKFMGLNNDCTVSGGASAVRQLVAAKPFIIFSSCSGSFSGAISTLKAVAPNTPVILDGNASLVGPSGLKNVYGSSPNYIGDCKYLMRYAAQTLHIRKVGLLYDNGPNGAPIATPCAAYGKSVGVTAIPTIGIPPQTTDYAGLGQTIASSGAGAWIDFSVINHFVSTQKAAEAAGYTGKWLVQSSNFSYSYIRLAGALANGVDFSSYIQPPKTTNTAAAKLFRRLVTNPAEAGVLGAQGWSAAYLVAYGVRTATAGGQALTQQAFEHALNTVSGKTMGLMPGMTYANGSGGISHVVSGINAESVYTIQHGAYVQIGPVQRVPA